MQIKVNTQLKTVLSVKVASILRQEIYSGKTRPQEHLNEVSIAARLGISRGPLRDAQLVFFKLNNRKYNPGGFLC